MICAVADVCIHTRKWTHRPTNSLSSLAEMQMLPGAWNTGVCRAFALTTHMEGTGITSSSPVGSRVLLAAFVRLCTFFLLTRWWFKNHEWYILHWFKKILIQPNGHDDQVRTCCYPTAPSQKLGATRTSMFWIQLYVVIPSHAVLLCAIGKWAVSLGKIWERHVVSGHTIVLALLCAWTCVHSGTTFIGTIRFYAAMEVLLWQHCLCFPAAKILYMCKPKPRKKVMSLEHSKTKKIQIISTRTIGKIVQKSEYTSSLAPYQKSECSQNPGKKSLIKNCRFFAKPLWCDTTACNLWSQPVCGPIPTTCAIWTLDLCQRSWDQHVWHWQRPTLMHVVWSAVWAKRKFWKPVRHLTIVYRVVTYTPL